MSKFHRIHLFEFEDFQWFPNFLRKCLTRYIVAMHRLLDTKSVLTSLVQKGLKYTSNNEIVDMCSGSGGPMIDVYTELIDQDTYKNTSLTLTDLYPNRETANDLNNNDSSQIRYIEKPVDATNIGNKYPGLRTMICSMHHMEPDIAKNILSSAKNDQEPILIYEISDNSIPLWIAWIAFPINVISVFIITPLVRPMSWQQIVFTYLIPVLPFFIAWDGAVSNVRTYTFKDLDLLTKDLSDESYVWEKGAIKGKGGKKLYLLGKPVNVNTHT